MNFKFDVAQFKKKILTTFFLFMEINFKLILILHFTIIYTHIKSHQIVKLFFLKTAFI